MTQVALASAPVAATPADTPVPNPLPRLLAGEDLTADDSEHLFERLVLGRLDPERLLAVARPVTVAHVFNDAFERGTSGVIEHAIPLQSTLEPGDRDAPRDAEEARGAEEIV